MQEQGVGELNDRLVAELVGAGVIEDSGIEEAFRAVLRHHFLPETALHEVYQDRAIVTHQGPDGIPVSSSSQPAIMARMLHQLDVRPGQRVLEIGAGTGYNAALLARLVGHDGEVTTVDLDPEVSAAARRHLQVAGVENVRVLAGDGWQGVPGRVFDRVEATVGVWDLSPAWVEQLEPGGVLVAPIWLRAGMQSSVAFRKVWNGVRRLESTSIEPCGFMRLRGQGAGQPTYEQVGPWVVSFDEPDLERAELLQHLLQLPPETEPAPPLSGGWFTTIALGQPDAVHLFSLASESPVVYRGILDLAAPGLAVVASQVGAAETIETRGSVRARHRLLHLLQTEAPVDVKQLRITALPSGGQIEEVGALAALVRPHFTFVIRRG